MVALSSVVCLSGHLLAASIPWRTDVESARAEASRTGRLLLIHFWSPSCRPCRELENTVFIDPNVGAALATKFVPVKVNAEADLELAQNLGVTHVPTDVVLTSTGEKIGMTRSPLSARDYVAEMSRLAAMYHTRGIPQSPLEEAAQLSQQMTSTQSAYANLPIGPASEQTAPATAIASPQQPSAGGLATLTPAPNDGTNTTNVLASMTSSQSALQAESMPLRIENEFAQQPPVETTSPVDTTAPVATTVQTEPSPAAHAPTESFGFEGYCPVSLKQVGKWVKGDARWGMNHRGSVYLFAGENELRTFRSAPDVFSPVLSGIDPVLALDQQQAVRGKRAHGLQYEGRIYLFASEATLQVFEANPEGYDRRVLEATRAADMSVTR